MSLAVLGLSLAACDISAKSLGDLGLEHYDRPASYGGYEVGDGSTLRDQTYGPDDNGAAAVGGLRELQAMTRDRLGRTLLIDQPSSAPRRLVRLSSGGELEVGFGDAGSVPLAGEAHSLTVDSMDRILVAGVLFVPPPNLPQVYARPLAHIARYHDDGSLDADFGEGGVALIPAPEVDHNSEALFVREDSRAGLLVFGHLLRPFQLPYVDHHKQETEVFVARLSAEGVLDTSFGTDGIARATLPTPSALGGADIDSMGRALLTGFLIPGAFSAPDPTPLAIWRFGLDGQPDTSFADSGRFLWSASQHHSPLSCTGRRIAHDSQERILVAGDLMSEIHPFSDWTHVLANGQQHAPIYDLALWRLTPDGELDPNFSSNGVVSLATATPGSGSQAGDNFDLLVDLVLDDQDRALVSFLVEEPFWEGASGYYTFQYEHACLLRLDAAGGLDPSFGAGDPLRILASPPIGMALDTEGALLFAGRDAGVWRLELP